MNYNDVQLKIQKALIQRKNPFDLKVVGKSMEPFIVEDEKVEVVKRETYRIGEIIVFKNKSDDLIIHRIISINNDFVFTKGDNAVAIEKLDVSSIVGRIENIYIDNNKKEIKYSKQDELISKLSIRMNRQRIKGGSYHMTMNSFCAKLIRVITFMKREKIIG